ncbi:hypothetical protein FBY06_11518 [Pseudomonas sp. SJZ085]|uniref:hypothetical protein n=1 Tax=unclassified Pseudomonas TaxID=196821 RepID=UPI00119A7B5E|nr:MULTISPECIES: hypothetical protein [unclassified Pseudomonas]TWC18093.1 hypothetical protein FBX99_11518 [Pseudomonas sp. SJZ074]TWC36065.1 hypothetical protein FBY06_11518 [Pseudomonas sp. SJZ085]
MDQLGHEWTRAQRKTLDRYARFLGSLRSILNNISVVLERRRSAGHQPSVPAMDSRWNNAFFNGQYLSALWGYVNALDISLKKDVEVLAVFSRDALDVTARFSRREAIEQVDFRLFNLSRSARWLLAPPTKVEDLTHELHLRFINHRSAIRQWVFRFDELYRESLGLSPVFISAMDHRACRCHTQPSVAQMLFQEAVTTPAWDLVYSSRDASIRAVEYKADIALLFKEFNSLIGQMGVLAQDLYRRMEDVVLTLRRASYAVRLGELNSRLSAVMNALGQCMALLENFETWLRK